MHILAIQKELALTRRERPEKRNFVFTPTARRPLQALFCRLRIGKTKLERDPFLGEPQGFGGILDRIIDLVGNKSHFAKATYCDYAVCLATIETLQTSRYYCPVSRPRETNSLDNTIR